MSFSLSAGASVFAGDVIIQGYGQTPGSFVCNGDAVINGNLAVSGGIISNLGPIPVVNVSSNTTLPNTLSTLTEVICGVGSAYTVILPHNASGYQLSFTNNNTVNTTIQSPTILYYESPLGTFTHSSSLAIIPHASIICISDGTNWFVFYNSGLYSPLQGQITALQSEIAGAVLLSANNTFTGTCAFTQALTVPAASISNSQLVNSAVRNGYVDFTSSGQTQLNTLAAAAVSLSANNTFTGANTFTQAVAVPAASITNAQHANAAIRSGYVDFTSSGQTQLNTLAASGVSLAANNTFTGANSFTQPVVVPAASITNAQHANAAIRSGYVDFTSSGQTQLNTLAASGVSLAADNTFTGANTFSQAVVVPASSITDAQHVNTAISSGYVDFTSSGQTQLNTLASAAVSLAADNTFTGANTFTQAVVVPSASITDAQHVNTAISSGFVDFTSSGQTQLNTLSSAISSVPSLASDQSWTGVNTFTKQLKANFTTGDGNNNTFYGVGCGNNSVATSNCTAMGSGCMASITSGNANTCIGKETGNHLSTGGNNALIGYQVGKAMTTAAGNVGMGYQSLLSCTTGQSNTIIGPASGGQLTSGNNNTVVGNDAGDGLSTGSNNTFIGTFANGSSTQSNATALGYSASTFLFDYSTALGYSATCTAANQVMIGTAAETVVVPGSLYVNSSQTTVSGSTSGNIVCTQPLRGSSLKKVVIYFSALNGSATYTFPVAFSYTPAVAVDGSGIAPLFSNITALSTTAVTFNTLGAVSGFIFLEGF